MWKSVDSPVMHAQPLATSLPGKSRGSLSRAIAAVFSPAVFRQLSETGAAPIVGATLEAAAATGANGRPLPTYEAAFEWCYDQLVARYRSEYVYKNAIANDIVLKLHGIHAALLFTELHVGSVIADVVVINGTSTAYEIKTELDTLDRLPAQLQSYQQVFDRTCVVTHANLVERLLPSLPDSVGVMRLNDHGTIEVFREPESRIKTVEPAEIFSVLRQSEYKWIIAEVFGEIPEVPNTKLFRECKALFCSLSPETAHHWFVAALRRRTMSEGRAALVAQVPNSLRVLAMTAGMRDRDIVRLVDSLSSSPFS